MNDMVSFELRCGKHITFSKPKFSKLLYLLTEGPYVIPTSQDLIDVFNSMFQEPYMMRVSEFKKNKLPGVWNLLFGFILHGLTCRTCVLDAIEKELLALFNNMGCI